MRTEPKKSPTETPSSDELRAALVARCQQFCELAGITKSELGRRAVADVAFVGDLEGGRNITLKLYDRMRKYLDAKWPSAVDDVKKRQARS